MYKLVIEYTQEPKDVYEASRLTGKVSEWLVDYEVYGCQCDHHCIAFDTDKMRTMAILYLCDEKNIKRLRAG